MPSEKLRTETGREWRRDYKATPNARHVDHPVEAAAGPAGHRRAAVFFSSDSAPGRSASGTSSDSASGGVTRGGFGSFARAFTSHFSGGG